METESVSEVSGPQWHGRYWKKLFCINIHAKSLNQFPAIQNEALGGELTSLEELRLDPSEYLLNIQPKLTSPQFNELPVVAFE